MDNGQFTNVRFKSLSLNKMKNEIKHELRLVKIKSVVNDNSNYYYIDEKSQGDFCRNEKVPQKVGNHFLNKLETIENLHRKLLRKNQNQSLNKERHNSFNTGVLTFSDSMNQLIKEDRDKVIQMGIKTIKNMCKELKTELHYITLHCDEDGIPHFHYFTNNFDNNGNSLSTKRNSKLGQKLQDLGNLYFKDLGFERGISKSISGRKHLSVREFKEYQETQKELEKMKTENKELKEENEKLSNEINEFKEEIFEKEEKLEKIKELGKKHQQNYQELIYDIYNDLTTLNEETNTEKFIKLIQRYVNTENKTKLEKVIEKYQKIVNKIKNNKTKEQKKQTPLIK